MENENKHEHRRAIPAVSRILPNGDLVELVYDAAKRWLVGIYLWKSKKQADAFYTTQWVATVTERRRSAPTKQEWSTPMVLESKQGELLAP